MMFLLGRHAMLGHEPPINPRSITTTRRPCSAKVHAMYLPASPPPRTRFSIFSVGSLWFIASDWSECSTGFDLPVTRVLDVGQRTWLRAAQAFQVAPDASIIS